MTKQERLLYQTALQQEKGFIGHIEKGLAGVEMEPKVVAVLAQKRGIVTELERKLGKE